MDLTTHPPMIGPRDLEPLMALEALLAVAAPEEERGELWPSEKLDIPEASLKVVARGIRALEKVKGRDVLGRIIAEPVGEPIHFKDRGFAQTIRRSLHTIC